jgi:hypothetical protein
MFKIDKAQIARMLLAPDFWAMRAQRTGGVLRRGQACACAADRSGKAVIAAEALYGPDE